MPTRKRLVIAVLALALAAAPAAGAPASIEITAPATGATISRSATPMLQVRGTAQFGEAVASLRRWYFRRDNCGTLNDNSHLSVSQADDRGDGCGDLVAAPVEQQNPITLSAIDGLPATVDATGKITGQVTLNSFHGVAENPVGLAAGQWELSVDVVALAPNGQLVSLLDVTRQYLVTPTTTTYTVAFEGEIDDAFADFVLSDLTAVVGTTAPTGVGIHGSFGLSGRSFLDMPILDAGTVAVSTSATFAASETITTIPSRDGPWSAVIATPPVGSRTLYARAVQSGVSDDAMPVPFTVTQ